MIQKFHTKKKTQLSNILSKKKNTNNKTKLQQFAYLFFIN